MYRLALQMVWRMEIGFALLGFIFCWDSRQLELHKEIQKDFDLYGKTDSAKDVSANEAQHSTG
jgi:hypothetical protein